MEAFKDISAMGVHDVCNDDARRFAAGETFFSYLLTDFNSISQISEYQRPPLLPLNAV